MEVTNATIDKLARLSKLKFDDQAKEDIKQDLTKMIDFIDKLNELDTDNVEPLLHMVDEVNVLRPDEPKTTITQKQALANAPKQDGTYFRVPKVVKG